MIDSPSSDCEIRDGVVVRPEDLVVAVEVVAERVEAVQRDPNVRGRHPALQLWAVLEVEGRGSALERGEGHVGPGQRGHVRVLGGAQGAIFVDLSLRTEKRLKFSQIKKQPKKVQIWSNMDLKNNLTLVLPSLGWMMERESGCW